MADGGNPNLRSMSIGKVRSLIALELRKDPEMKRRYELWVGRYNDQKNTFNSSYRGCDTNNSPGRIRMID